MFRSRRFGGKPHPVRAALDYRDRLRGELAAVEEFLDAARKLAETSGSGEFGFMLMDDPDERRCSHLRLIKT